MPANETKTETISKGGTTYFLEKDGKPVSMEEYYKVQEPDAKAKRRLASNARKSEEKLKSSKTTSKGPRGQGREESFPPKAEVKP